MSPHKNETSTYEMQVSIGQDSIYSLMTNANPKNIQWQQIQA